MASVTKLLLTELPNFQALAISSLFAFLFLFLLNLRPKVRQTFRRYRPSDYGNMSLLGFLGLFLYSALYSYGLQRLTSQEACILNYLWPVTLVVFSCILLKEKMTLIKGIAIGGSFVGIILLSTGGTASESGHPISGILCCVAAAVCYGLFSVLNQKSGYDQQIAMMVFWLTVSIASTIAGLLTEQWVPLTGMHWLGLLWLGVVVNAIAYLLWALALKGADSTAKIANLAYLTPFLSLVVSAVLLQESLRPRALLALLFILGGILLQLFHDTIRTKRKSPLS